VNTLLELANVYDLFFAPQKDTPPLSWQSRICIACEMASGLLFLHNCKPEAVSRFIPYQFNSTTSQLHADFIA
jgi:hypothetical protein